MFDAQEKLIAARLIECALEGISGSKLIECVRKKFPDAALGAVKRAAFFAVTRPGAGDEVIGRVYDIGLKLRDDQQAPEDEDCLDFGGRA